MLKTFHQLTNSKQNYGFLLQKKRKKKYIWLPIKNLSDISRATGGIKLKLSRLIIGFTN